MCVYIPCREWRGMFYRTIDSRPNVWNLRHEERDEVRSRNLDHRSIDPLSSEDC